MKQLLFFLFLVSICYSSDEMLKTISGDYCRVSMEWQNGIHAKVYSEENSIGQSLLDSNSSILKFTTDIAVIQYMADHNWILVNGFLGPRSVYMAYFRRKSSQ